MTTTQPDVRTGATTVGFQFASRDYDLDDLQLLLESLKRTLRFLGTDSNRPEVKPVMVHARVERLSMQSPLEIWLQIIAAGLPATLLARKLVDLYSAFDRARTDSAAHALDRSAYQIARQQIEQLMPVSSVDQQGVNATAEILAGTQSVSVIRPDGQETRIDLRVPPQAE